MSVDLEQAFAQHRASLLRHCYRMTGSYADAEDVVQEAFTRAWAARASYAGRATAARWLQAIATNACLNALAKKKPLLLPQLESEPVAEVGAVQEQDRALFLSPAADARLFPDPAEAAESRETVALAFIALLQRLPARQRAALLLKDVLGWPADEIAQALELSVGAVNSALHRAREGIAGARAAAEEPPPEGLRGYLRAWEERDFDTLVALMRDDVTFAMPPHSFWLRGAESVERFLRSPRFQAFWVGLRTLGKRANGVPAVAFYRAGADGVVRRHSIGVTRFAGGRVAESTVFIGPGYFAGFDLPESL